MRSSSIEKWGLPIWKDEAGNYVHEGRWQLMINGESYKVVVAEAAKNALGIVTRSGAHLHPVSDHRSERIGVQTGSSDQRSVDVGLGHNRGHIPRIH